MNTKKPSDHTNPEKEEKIDLPGYPIYPASDDVYSQFKEESNLDPEDVSKIKEPNEDSFKGNNEKDFREAVSGSDLDIPGSEPDEKQENMGSEDEENNFYSLGGDGHNDLEEDNG
jgi:hypothetical protein